MPSRYEPEGTRPRRGDWVQDDQYAFQPYVVIHCRANGSVLVEGICGGDRPAVKRWVYDNPRHLLVFRRRPAKSRRRKGAKWAR